MRRWPGDGPEMVPPTSCGRWQGQGDDGRKLSGGAVDAVEEGRRLGRECQRGERAGLGQGDQLVGEGLVQVLPHARLAVPLRTPSSARPFPKGASRQHGRGEERGRGGEEEDKELRVNMDTSQVHRQQL